jgi:prephenate dehydrogenase
MQGDAHPTGSLSCYTMIPATSSYRGSLSTYRVAILGLGLMGGSLALALRGKCHTLLGVDPDLRAVTLAQEKNVVDQVSTDPAVILPQADVVILAAPVRSIINLLDELPHLHPSPAMVLDLGSTKAQVVTAMEALPANFSAVGGHPMCGKERGGLENADPLLFRDAPFAFTPTRHTTPAARALAEELALAVGARPLWLDAETHDRWVAATSHLPYLLANALAFTTPLDASPLAGPGFRSTARLAVSSPGMTMDILITNRDNVLEAVQRFKAHLGELESLLASGDFTKLEIFLRQGAERQRTITATRQGDD